MRRRHVIVGGLLVTAVAFLVGAFRGPKHRGELNNPGKVDFEHVIECAFHANAAYHRHDQIRKNVGDGVAIREFPKSGLRIFITRSEGTGMCWVVIRGTANLSNTLSNINSLQQKSHELQINVHRGFNEAMQECLPWVVENIDREEPVILTGHSLGGAVAALMLAVLERRGFEAVSAVTFGQPKVTDRYGADTFGHLKLLRVVHEADPVPFVPYLAATGGQGPNVYQHFGAEVVLKPDGHFFYLEKHQEDRIDVRVFWRNFTNIRPRTHDMIMGYKPVLEKALKLSDK